MKPEPKIGKFTDNKDLEFFDAIEASDVALKGKLTPGRNNRIVKKAKKITGNGQVTISLWIANNDLARLKSKAVQEGMPYQTLINSILHKAVT